jgi:hypothetical protein
MFSCQKGIKFVILNAPRTGSNFLCTVLNSHPDILCHHEIFNPHVIGVARHLHGTDFHLGTMDEREADPHNFLDRMWRANDGRRAVGFKLCLWQHQRAYDHVLPDKAVRKVILKRRNRVKTFVSLLLARQTGEWVVYDDVGAPAPRPRVHVEPDALLENVALQDRFYSETESALRRSGQPYIELWYEDLFGPDALASVLDFLEMTGPPLLPSGETWKLTPVALNDVVANFDVLAQGLRGSSLEAELHDTMW